MNATFSKTQQSHFIVPVLLVMLQRNGSGRYKVRMKLMVTHTILNQRKLLKHERVQPLVAFVAEGLSSELN
jgi:hypothetical protein